MPFLARKDSQKVIHINLHSIKLLQLPLLWCSKKNFLDRLQMIQNTAARLLKGTWKYDHITPVLRSLHWLTINFKIFQCLFLNLEGECALVVAAPRRPNSTLDNHQLSKFKRHLKTYFYISFWSCMSDKALLSQVLVLGFFLNVFLQTFHNFLFLFYYFSILYSTVVNTVVLSCAL